MTSLRPLSHYSKSALQALAVLGSSTAGVTALLYLAGFLAFGGNNWLLGFTSFPLSPDDYLRYGAAFFSDLPSVVFTLASLLLEDLAVNLPRLAVPILVLAVIGVIGYVLRRRVGERRIRILSGLAHSARPFLLVGFVVILFLLVLIVSAPLQQYSDLAFAPRGEISFTVPVLGSDLTYDDWTSGSPALRRLYASIVAVAGFSALGFRALLPLRGMKAGRFLLGLSALLLLYQALFVPVNFGILMMPKTYPVTEVRMVDATRESALPDPLALVHETDADYFFYTASPPALIRMPRQSVSFLSLGRRENILAWRRE